MTRLPRALSIAACVALLSCGGAADAPLAPSTNDTPTAGADEPAARSEEGRALLSQPSAEWIADPAYASVDLPFVMGHTARPCDAEYSVQGYPRIDATFTYEDHRIVVSVTPGEMSGEGHAFCLPSPPFLWALELEPLTMTWELDERGRVIGTTIEEAGEVRSRKRYVNDGERWTGVAYGDGEVQPIEWRAGVIASVPLSNGGVRSFELEGEGRLVDGRNEAPNGALNIWQYQYEEHSPRLARRTFQFYPDPEGDPSISEDATFEYGDDGRLVSCTRSSDDGPLTIRYAYDGRGRLTQRRAVVIEEFEGETQEQEAFAWSYRYDCSEPRPDDE